MPAQRPLALPAAGRRSPRFGAVVRACAGLASLALAACAGSATPIEPSPPAAASPTRPLPTPTPSPTPSPTPVPRPLVTVPPPPGFQSRELRPEVAPAAYVNDACEYLARRWDPERSRPGTVVVPLMYHSIRHPLQMLDDGVTTSTDYLQATVDSAVRLGFETITTEALIGFLTENAPIPARSMILIVDDRFPGALAEYLLPAIAPHDWTVTLGWIIGNTGPDLWAFMENLAAGGRLDVQSHGLNHRYDFQWMSDDEMRQEIGGSIPILEQHFGSRPLAFVWPGGNFTARSLEIARQEGYRLGFTAYSRGPLLFNWIPLGPEETDAGDPLMVLPRYWSTAAINGLEQSVRIAEAAARHAEAARADEAAWYAASCGGALPGA